MRAVRVLIAGLAVGMAAAGCAAGGPDKAEGKAAPAGSPAASTSGQAPTVAPGKARPSSAEKPSARTPKPVPRERGGTLWVLVLAITDKHEPTSELTNVATRYAAYLVGPTCDEGAEAGLRLKPEKVYWYAALYFASQRDAFTYKGKYTGGVIGIVKVVPYNGLSAEDCVRTPS